MKAAKLTHIGPSGEARMIDISDKPATTREARARGVVRMRAEAFAAIVGGKLPKGEVITTARIAGIQAAKRASELIQMGHPLYVTLVDVDCDAYEWMTGMRIE